MFLNVSNMFQSAVAKETFELTKTRVAAWQTGGGRHIRAPYRISTTTWFGDVCYGPSMVLPSLLSYLALLWLRLGTVSLREDWNAHMKPVWEHTCWCPRHVEKI